MTSITVTDNKIRGEEIVYESIANNTHFANVLAASAAAIGQQILTSAANAIRAQIQAQQNATSTAVGPVSYLDPTFYRHG